MARDPHTILHVLFLSPIARHQKRKKKRNNTADEEEEEEDKSNSRPKHGVPVQEYAEKHDTRMTNKTKHTERARARSRSYNENDMHTPAQ